MGGIHLYFVGQLQQLVVQTVIKHPGQLLRRMGSGEIGTAYVSEKERIAGSDADVK